MTPAEYENWDEIVAAGVELAEQERALFWQLGDVGLAAWRAQGGSGSRVINAFAAEIGYGQTAALWQYTRCAEAFPEDVRGLPLSLIHFRHALLLPPERRESALERAADEGWSGVQFYRWIKGEDPHVEKHECSCGHVHTLKGVAA